MTRDYHEHKVPLGYSDIASLTIRTQMMQHTLNLGEDGSYSAYVVHDQMPSEIPSHYHLALTIPHSDWGAWAWIYDDDGLKARINSQSDIEIYRAGLRGILINVHGQQSVIAKEVTE